MQGDEEHRRIVLEDILCAIAVVDVPIENEDFLDAVIALEISSPYRDIVEEAEARADVRMSRVMTRRTNNAESVLPVLVDDSIDCLEDAACADIRGMRWMCIEIGINQVHFFLFRVFRPHAFDEIDVGRIVNVFNYFPIGRREFVYDFYERRFQKVLCCQMLENTGQTRWTFYVLLHRFVLQLL